MLLPLQRFLLEFLRAGFAGKALYEAVLKWIGILFVFLWAVNANDSCVITAGNRTLHSTVGISIAIALATIWVAIALAIAWSKFRYPVFQIADGFVNLPNTGWSNSLRILGVMISNHGFGQSEAHVHIDKLIKTDGTPMAIPLPQEMSWLNYSDIPKLSKGLPAYAKIFEIEPFATTMHYLKICAMPNSLHLGPVSWGGGSWRFWVHILVRDADVMRVEKWFLIEVDTNLGFIANPGKPPFLSNSLGIMSKIKRKIERWHLRIHAEIGRFLKRKIGAND
jgi:hypothetical protein